MVMRAAAAIFTIAVRRNVPLQRAGTQMRRLAEELDRGLGILVLELPVGRAHAADRRQLARGALGRARALLLPHRRQELFPALLEAALAEVVLIVLRQHAHA